jgi:hypothetical protein
MTLAVHSGRQSWAAGAVSNLGAIVAPCDGVIVSLDIAVLVAANNAGAKLNFGTVADPDAYLDAYPLNAVGAGVYQVVNATEMVGRNVSKGDVLVFELEAASATGSLAATAIIAPRSSHV